MKHERDLNAQTRRIDREKANKPVVVQQIPETGREGDSIFVGEPTAPPNPENAEGYYIRLEGQWRQVGISEEEVVNVADEQIAAAPRPARVDNVDSTVLLFGEESTIEKQYEQGNPFRDAFIFKNFATAQDREDDNELPVSERPINVSFDPLTPVQREGTHLVEITFTPQRAGRAIAELYLE